MRLPCASFSGEQPMSCQVRVPRFGHAYSGWQPEVRSDRRCATEGNVYGASLCPGLQCIDQTCNRRFGPVRGQSRRIRPRRGLQNCAKQAKMANYVKYAKYVKHVCPLGAAGAAELGARPLRRLMCSSHMPPPRGRQRRRGAEWSIAQQRVDERQHGHYKTCDHNSKGWPCTWRHPVSFQVQ